jgi:hypothetical protein
MDHDNKTAPAQVDLPASHFNHRDRRVRWEKLFARIAGEFEEMQDLQ